MERSAVKTFGIFAAAFAAAAFLGLFGSTDRAGAESNVRFRIHIGGHSGHYGYHGYHKYRGHYGRHGYHGYRKHRYYQYYPRRHHYYRRHRSRHYYYRHRYPHSYYYSRHDYDRSKRDSGYGSVNETSIYSKGWSHLASGRAEAALTEFANQASHNPGAGVPKIGYALASAMRHNDSRAVWAMRRALRHDPRALNRVPSSQKLDYRIGELIDRYRHRSGAEYQRADDAFMTAALAYLHGDHELARKAVDHAVESGDREASTLELDRMIGHRRQNSGRGGAGKAPDQRSGDY
jgi:hypothetical protein